MVYRVNRRVRMMPTDGNEGGPTRTLISLGDGANLFRWHKSGQFNGSKMDVHYENENGEKIG